jgi:hypothetical protein
MNRHTTRQFIIENYRNWLLENCTKKELNKILNNPFEVYDNNLLLRMMAFHEVQKRTAKEWLISAQIRLKENIEDFKD